MERLTIDEIIEHCERKTKMYEEVGKSIDFETTELTDAIKEYWEHKQVKDYLEELKAYREIVTVEECKNSVLDIERTYNKGYADGSLSVTSEIRNKVIDDFAERLSEYLNVENATKYGNKNAEQQGNSYDTLMKYEIANAIDDISEQLKEGGENVQKK